MKTKGLQTIVFNLVFSCGLRLGDIDRQKADLNRDQFLLAPADPYPAHYGLRVI
jgi:hypothetical protein